MLLDGLPYLSAVRKVYSQEFYPSDLTSVFHSVVIHLLPVNS